MKKLKWPGSTLLMPVPPTLVSCGTVEKPNALTIAWTGIINSQPPKTYISIRPERYSYNIIKESGEFVINMPTAKMVRAIDYCGCRSGEKENKIAAMGLTAIECEGSSCPQIEESPIALTCKVTEIVKMGSHDMFLADITGVIVDEALLDKKGKLQIEKAGLIAYAHGQYFELGKKIGSFGFSVQKNNNKSKRNDTLRNDTVRYDSIKKDMGRFDASKGRKTVAPNGLKATGTGKVFGKAPVTSRTSKSFGGNLSNETANTTGASTGKRADGKSKAASGLGKGYGSTGTRVSNATGKSKTAQGSKDKGYMGKGNKK